MRIFESVNIKHKAILMLAYSVGLRVSEVVKLRVQDIDTKRNMIHIKGAKGREDRYTVPAEIYTHVSQRDIGRIKSPLDFGKR
jgi:site-specific recombinase XerD